MMNHEMLQEKAAAALHGDPSLSVGVRAGLYQLQRVTLRPGRAADVQPLTDWISLSEVLRVLSDRA